MASILSNFCRKSSYLTRNAVFLSGRKFHGAGALLQTPQENKAVKGEEEKKGEGGKDEQVKRTWLSKLLMSDINPVSESHSSLLADKETVYEIQFHSVKPECMETYLKELVCINHFNTNGRIHVHTKTMKLIEEMKTGAELVASWTAEVGDLDEAVHLWKFVGGYPVLNNHKHILRTNQDFLEFRNKRNKMLRYRKNQILLAFSFWKDIVPRKGPNIYELRSYTLKPGMMIEWGNHWARGLKYRQEQNESVAGFFSHIGELYNAHHLWAYESLQSRQEVRETAWSRPGWDELVANTAKVAPDNGTCCLVDGLVVVDCVALVDFES